MNKQDIIREIRDKRLPVIICGAGVVGRVLLSLCRDEGIEVECFCDSSRKAADSKSFCGLEIVYTPDLKAKYGNAVFLISVAAIKDVVELLRGMGFSNWYAGGPLLKDMDVSQPEPSLDYMKFAIENCILCHDGYLHPDRLFLRSVDLIITERCSLKCRDCSNLMQYYENPKNCDTDTVMRSINAFCAVIDEVMDFRVLGGDAFVNKEWPTVVSRLTAEPKAGRVVLYTNGVIVPGKKDLACLRNKKVLVIATDYGPKSKKLAELTSGLKENGIAYHVLKAVEWLDCAAITPHNRGPAGNREIFRLCCAKNMLTLSDGKLFRCPYAGNAFRLSAVPDCESDYVDLFREPLAGEGLAATKRKVREYVFRNEPLNICDFCNGRPLSGNEVEPAVQTPKPLPYRRYRE